MKKSTKRRWKGFCATGVSVVVVLGMGQMTQGAPSYRAAPQGLETPAEMQSYDPTTLHITFGKPPEAPEADTSLRPASAGDPAPEDLFDPARLPADAASGDGKPVDAAAPEALLSVPQQSTVPEPGTFVLVGLGVLGLIMRCRQRKRFSCKTSKKSLNV